MWENLLTRLLEKSRDVESFIWNAISDYVGCVTRRIYSIIIICFILSYVNHFFKIPII